MSLKKQLLAFGLLTLVLPWAGLRVVQEMEAALRTGLEQSMLTSAQTLAHTLERLSLLSAGPARDAAQQTGQRIHARALAASPTIDGIATDWSVNPDSAVEFAPGGRYIAGVSGPFVYLYLDIDDADVVYQRAPGEAPFGDRVVLSMSPSSGPSVGPSSGQSAAPANELVLLTTSAGNLRARQTRGPRFEPGDFEDRVLAAWRETPSGFAVELRLPASLVGQALGIGVVDVDAAANGPVAQLHASWDPSAGGPGAFTAEREDLGRLIAQFERPGARFRILDRSGWIIADEGELNIAGLLREERPQLLTEDIFRWLLRREDPPYESVTAAPGRIVDEGLLLALAGEPATGWFTRGTDATAIVIAAVPVRENGEIVGAAILEQASESILTLTNRALMTLTTISVLAMLVVALGLLSFAMYLSFRVRRLARAAETALGPKGEIAVELPGRRARDEIGDLSRSFTDLLRRLREHTSYLRTLTSKLSHELRTPLAVVSTSLDNLEHEHAQSRGGGDSGLYLKRLREGANRLDRILVAMSEATRIEQSIADTTVEEFDLVEVVESCARAYKDIHGASRIAFHSSIESARIEGSHDLIAQMLDKLIDNAAGFATPGTPIRIEIAESEGDIRLSVSNLGPPLPETMRGQLFDSLVSIREQKGEDPHLGLGLYIVSLIADFHNASAQARNLEGNTGAEFRMTFPAAGKRRKT